MTSLWDRLFGKGEPDRPPLPANDVEDLLEDIREQIRNDVAAGFDDPDTILRGAIELYDGEIDPKLAESRARLWLDEELAAHAAEQQGWPETTDCDRLDAAFAALEAGGVVARQHFTCCGTCGSAEILDEMKAVEANGGSTRGYAFYHWQDTEAAVDGRGIYLNYGAAEDGEVAATTIGRDIVAELERHGLTADWDGSWGKRIGVALDWKRRRTV